MKSINKLLLPSTDGAWELWERSSDGWSVQRSEDAPADFNGSAEGALVGLPSAHCRTVAMALPEASGEELHDMVFSQLERRRLIRSDDSPRFQVHPLPEIATDLPAGVANTTSYSVDILAKDLPEELCLEGAGVYAPAARLFTYPDGKLVLQRDGEGLVLCAARGGKLAHSHVISGGGEIHPGLAQELRTTALTLEAEGVISGIEGVELWGDFPPGTAGDLARVLGAPVTHHVRAAPSASGLDADHDDDLLPAQVEGARRRSENRRKLTRLLAIAGVAYLVAAALFWFYSSSRRSRVDELRAEVAQTDPAARAVQASAERWGAMRPAFDIKLFPVVILDRVTALLPTNGVVIDEFKVTGERVQIEGHAKDPQAAHQLLEAIQTADDLPELGWAMPSPRMTTDQGASFAITGTPAT